MKTLFKSGTALLFSVIMGLFLSAMFALPALAVAIPLASLIPTPSGAMAGVYKEVWTGELVKKFRSAATFLSEISSYDAYVNNDVIHLVDVGADPDVLINNTTYPIAVSGSTDTDISISLDKFDTTNTSVTQDELYAISYDKIQLKVEQHGEALTERIGGKAAHALAPAQNSATTPVLLTTGASNGEAQARKRLTPADVRKMKRKFDDMKVPKMGRVLVLCNAHIEDLLAIDENFEKQYKNIRTGDVLQMYGFKIYEFADNPIYAVDATVLKKKAFGAAAAPTTDQDASFVFYAPRMFKAMGSTEMFFRDKAIDPEYRRSVVGFRQRFIALPKKNEAIGALVSAIV